MVVPALFVLVYFLLPCEKVAGEETGRRERGWAGRLTPHMAPITRSSISIRHPTGMDGISQRFHPQHQLLRALFSHRTVSLSRRLSQPKDYQGIDSEAVERGREVGRGRGRQQRWRRS